MALTRLVDSKQDLTACVRRNAALVIAKSDLKATRFVAE